MSEQQPMSEQATSATATPETAPTAPTGWSRIIDASGIALFVLGFAVIVALDEIQGTLRDEFVPSTIIWFLVAFVGFVLMLRIQSARETAFDWRWLLAVGFIARLALLTTVPTLSDDVWRYIWEGNLVNQGVSPFSVTIDSPIAETFNIEAREFANNTSFASPYLPVAHAVFALTVLVLPSAPWAIQLVMIGFDTLAVAAMIKLLPAVGLPARRSLIYWLNPLVVIEIGHGAHLDAIIVGLTMLSLWLTFDVSKRSTWAIYAAPLVFAAATLTRPLTLLFVPILFWVWNWPQRVIFGLAASIPVLIAGAWVGFGLIDPDGTGVFGTIVLFSEDFRFNTAIYQALERWLGQQGVTDSVGVTRVIVAILVISSMAAIFVWARRKRDDLSTLRLLAVPMMMYLLLTPILHPWYTLLLLLMLPFLAPRPGESLLRWISVAPWLTLAALLIFSYLTYIDNEAHAELSWVRHLEWYPTLGLLGAAVAAALWWNRPSVSTGTSTRNS